MENIAAIVVFGLMAAGAFYGLMQAQRDAANTNPPDSYGITKNDGSSANRVYTNPYGRS